MKISDSLRQEMMPEMVFSICRLAKVVPSKNQIKRLITLGHDGESVDQFNKVYQFALACEFIQESGDGTVKSSFSDIELSSFRRFRYAVLSNVFHGPDTNFTSAAKWYMAEDVPQVAVEGTASISPFSLNSASEFLLSFRSQKVTVDENFVNGFRFWMNALGLVTFNPLGSASNARPPLLFAAHRAIQDWLEYEMPFTFGTLIPARSFFDRLIVDCPVFEKCIRGNNLSSSLSAALRVLDSMGFLELTRVTDAGDVWHLVPANFYGKSNDSTDIMVRGGAK